jgi:2-succinyl-6-hydroxy-2,4-cyclohexadiene-1-carboxylate synthase
MPDSFTVEVAGTRLAVERRGRGTPLVLVHGMAGTRGDWDRLVAALPADYPLLRYDLRGFGQSDPLDGMPYSHGEDLRALLDALGIARAPVIGASMGGGIALNLALGHPARVSRLILVGSAMVGWQWSADWLATWRTIANATRAGDLAQARALWLAHPMFATMQGTEAGEEMRRTIEAYHGLQWFRDFQRDEMPDVDRLHSLAMPTLVVTGAREVPEIRLIADTIAGAAPTVDRIDFPDTGHMLHMERPAELAALILREKPLALDPHRA